MGKVQAVFAGLLGAVASACVGGGGGGEEGLKDLVPPSVNDALVSTGYAEAGLTITDDDGHVTVAGTPREEREEFQLMLDYTSVVVWRLRPGRIEAVTARVDHGTGVAEQTWARSELEAHYGPRPAGLDDGQHRVYPPRVQQPDINDDVETAYDRIDNIMRDAITAVFPDQAPGPRENRGSAEACYESKVFNPKPTGKYYKSLGYTLYFDEPIAQAKLPALVDYFRGKGADVDESDLDVGGASIYVLIEGFGIAISGVSENDGRITFGTSTGCLEPGPSTATSTTDESSSP